jgi:hypothetical protein
MLEEGFLVGRLQGLASSIPVFLTETKKYVDLASKPDPLRHSNYMWLTTVSLTAVGVCIN